jgi:hypothetical protein
MVSGVITMVRHFTHNRKFQGSSLAARATEAENSGSFIYKQSNSE